MFGMSLRYGAICSGVQPSSLTIWSMSLILVGMVVPAGTSLPTAAHMLVITAPEPATIHDSMMAESAKAPAVMTKPMPTLRNGVSFQILSPIGYST